MTANLVSRKSTSKFDESKISERSYASTKERSSLVRKNTSVESRVNKQNTTKTLSKNVYEACVEGNVEKLIGLLKRLKDPAKALQRRDRDGQSALHYGVMSKNAEMVRFLLDNKAEAFSSKARGFYPIHIAVRQKATDIIKMLLRNGGHDPNLTDKQGRNAMHHAAVSGVTHIVKLIAENTKNGIDFNARDFQGMKPIDMASTHTCADLIQQLMKTNQKSTSQTRELRSLQTSPTHLFKVKKAKPRQAYYSP